MVYWITAKQVCKIVSSGREPRPKIRSMTSSCRYLTKDSRTSMSKIAIGDHTGVTQQDTSTFIDNGM